MIKRPIILAGYIGSSSTFSKYQTLDHARFALKWRALPVRVVRRHGPQRKIAGGLRLENSWLDKAAWRVMLLVYVLRRTCCAMLCIIAGEW